MKKNLCLILLALTLVSVPATARRHRGEAAPEAAPAAPGLPPPDDVAKFLAGMPLPKNSPLAPLTQDPAWQEHAAYFEQAFAKLNTKQLVKLHKFQDTYLQESKAAVPVAYYMFSGPDFLYVDQFFPRASVYVMCGKESMGPPPDPFRIPNLSAAFHNLESSMHDALNTSYFITKDMKVDLEQQNLSGTLPIIYVFLARAGKDINDVTFVNLGGTRGVKITYSGGRSGQQVLYYFTTDISDGGIASNPAFMKFCNQFGVGYSFLKSSSYLMFEEGFNRVRNFILEHSSMIVQDDSGIPLANFNENWDLRVFGTYVGPIALFRQHDQPRLKEMFAQTAAPPLTIGFGYQWNYTKANLIVAKRK